MLRKLVLCGMLPAVVAIFSACETQTCDQVEREPCDNSASNCVSEKCDGKEGDDYIDCWEVLCVPALCECLETVGCAWQETSCDDPNAG